MPPDPLPAYDRSLGPRRHPRHTQPHYRGTRPRHRRPRPQRPPLPLGPSPRPSPAGLARPPTPPPSSSPVPNDRLQIARVATGLTPPERPFYRASVPNSRSAPMFWCRAHRPGQQRGNSDGRRYDRRRLRRRARPWPARLAGAQRRPRPPGLRPTGSAQPPPSPAPPRPRPTPARHPPLAPPAPRCLSPRRPPPTPASPN